MSVPLTQALDPVKLLCCVITLCLCGCASDPRLNTPANSSRLSYSVSSGSKYMDGGIVTVDHFRMGGAPVAQVRIPAGFHRVGYRCNGFLYIDMAPAVTFTFKAGVDYRMTCGKDGVAVVVAE